MSNVNCQLSTLKKVGILGIARSGIAAAEKLNKLGIEVLLSDSKANPPALATINYQLSTINYQLQTETGGHTDKLLDCDLLIVSPGIPLTIPILQRAKEKGIPLWSEIELGYRLTHPDTKIIAVTGSNGKSTTASLIAHILREAGYDTILAGNIGDAYCSFDIEQMHNFIVLEISSFQLELIDSFKPDVAVILNITPDHLDRYADIYEYARAKLNIFKNMDAGGIRIINENDTITAELIKADNSLKDMKFITFSDNDYTGTLTFGANIPPAVLAVSPFLSNPVKTQYIASLIDTFKPLEHRLEPVAETNGVSVINDSKATNTDSVIFALKSITPPIHIILGGSDKGEDYTQMVNTMIGKVKKAYIIGQTGPAIAQTINKINVGANNNTPIQTSKQTIPYEIYSTFETAIHSALKNAQEGEVVLLSPACASFDMFKNYEHRGREFKRIVHSIVGNKNTI